MRRVDRMLACLALLVVAAAAALPPALERLPPQSHRQWLAVEATWNAMTPSRQQALRQRMARWHALPAAVQRKQREQWQAWQALPAAQRAQLDAAAAAYAALPTEQRNELRRHFDALDVSEQRGWLLGPVLGADYMRLQPLLAQVPADEREPLLAQLRAMSAAERNDLARLAQRIAPQQRDALRRGLLATSTGNRAAWLQLRLEQ